MSRDETPKVGILPSKNEFYLASDWLESIRERTLERIAPVWSHGSMWFYEPGQGIWEDREDADIRGEIQRRYHGQQYQGDKELKRIGMTARLSKSILDCARDQSYQRDYFGAVERVSLGFRDGVLAEADITEGVGPMILTKPKSYEHRLRTSYDFGLGDTEGDPVEFLRFLKKVMPNKRIRDYLQEYVGACLFGGGSKTQKALLFVGSGANGKSTLLNILAKIFPHDSVSHVSPHSIEKDHFKAVKLDGPRINLVDESPTRELAESNQFKSIITGDPIMARKPYGQDYTFRPQAGHIFSANELPASSDHTDGYWRRLTPIPFDIQIPPDERIPGLATLILYQEKELAKIVGWAVEGARRVLKNGWVLPDLSESEALLQRWRDESDSVRAWISEERDYQPEEPRSEWPSVADIYQDYKKWAKDAGAHPVGKIKFRRRLEGAGVATAQNRSRRWIVALFEKSMVSAEQASWA